jgi:hypothetical protein
MITFLTALALFSIFPAMFLWEDYDKRKDEGGGSD